MPWEIMARNGNFRDIGEVPRVGISRDASMFWPEAKVGDDSQNFRPRNSGNRGGSFFLQRGNRLNLCATVAQMHQAAGPEGGGLRFPAK